MKRVLKKLNILLLADEELPELWDFFQKEKLKNINFDLVFSSPLSRAYNTAKIIYDGNIIVDDRIIERDNGYLEGKLKSEIKDKIDFNDDKNNIYNIETITSFRGRINNFFDDITKSYKDKTILVVTHAGVGIYARCYFEGEPENNDYSIYKMSNCEILEYEL